MLRGGLPIAETTSMSDTISSNEMPARIQVLTGLSPARVSSRSRKRPLLEARNTLAITTADERGCIAPDGKRVFAPGFSIEHLSCGNADFGSSSCRVCRRSDSLSIRTLHHVHQQKGLLLPEDGAVTGVVLVGGKRVSARALVLTTGTFVNGLLFC